ncbi:phage baseplate protein, partial [Listeria innocua]|uniref:phage distal tail protein domain-containing protein n=1 Tax=Listeria innocua TaxID=1642 RepID=UPI0016266B90
LGVSFANEYVGVGSNFIQSASNINQNTFELTVLFGGINENPYQAYADFIQFLSYAPLQLEYTIETGVYLRECALNTLTKTEIGEWNVLEETLTLDFLSPWYVEKTADATRYEDQSGDGKIYAPEIDITSEETSRDYSLNLLDNADFSNGIDGWTIPPGNLPYIRISDETAIGTNKILVADGVDNETFSINLAKNIDTSSILAGDKISFSFYVKLENSYEPYIFGAGYFQLKNASDEALFPIWDNYNGSYPENPIQDSSNVKYYVKNMNEWKYVEAIYSVENIEDIPQKLSIFFTLAATYYFTAPNVHIIDEVAGNGKNYYVYDYIYEETEVNSLNPNYFNITNDSMDMGIDAWSPTAITVKAERGDVVNPSWQLFVGSSIVQTDGYFLTIPKGSMLVVSSFPQDQFARVYNIDGSYYNVYSYQDLTKTNFISIPNGDSSLIFNVDANADVYLMYREERLLV